MSKNYVTKLKKILALALTFAMVFSILPMQATAAQQSGNMSLAGYALSFAGDNFPSTYQAEEGQRNLVFSQHTNMTFADGGEGNFGGFAPLPMDIPFEEPIAEELPAVPETEDEEAEEEPKDEEELTEEEPTEEEPTDPEEEPGEPEEPTIPAEPDTEDETDSDDSTDADGTTENDEPTKNDEPEEPAEPENPIVSDPEDDEFEELIIEDSTLLFASRIANTAFFGWESIIPVFDLFWYQDGVRRVDKGTQIMSLHDIGNSMQMELAFDEVTVADMGVWTLRAYSFSEFVESPHALFLQVGEVEAVEIAALEAEIISLNSPVMNQQDLRDALDAINRGDVALITFGASFEYTDNGYGIWIDGDKDITFDLGPHELTVRSGAPDGYSAMGVSGSDTVFTVRGTGTLNLIAGMGANQHSPGLSVNGEATVNLEQGATLNASSFVGSGVLVMEDAVATVTNARAFDIGHGAFAMTGAFLTVTEAATASNGWAGASAEDGGLIFVGSHAIGAWTGAHARGDGSQVIVNDTAIGRSNGAFAEYDGEVIVGHALGEGSYSVGAGAENDGTVLVRGTARGDDSGAIARSGGEVTVMGIATGDNYVGAAAYEGGIVDVGFAVGGDLGAFARDDDSHVTVRRNATGDGGAGARAENNGEIIVFGDATGNDGGAQASHGGVVTVNGTATGKIYYGADAHNGGTVRVGHAVGVDVGANAHGVDSSVTVLGTATGVLTGASAYDDGTVTVGNATATCPDDGIGAHVWDRGVVVVTSGILAYEYVRADGQSFELGDHVEPSNRPGHFMYTAWEDTSTNPPEDYSYVFVRYPAPPQPQPEPTPTPAPPSAESPQTPIPGSSATSTAQNATQASTGLSFGGAAGSRGVNFSLSRPRDITITLNAGGNSLRGLRHNGRMLEEDVDYTIDGDKVTLTADFMSILPRGRNTITFVMSGGTSLTLLINVRGGVAPAAATP